MNRIILIGNGFDLAHGLKTSYKDFLEWVKYYKIIQKPDDYFEHILLHNKTLEAAKEIKASVFFNQYYQKNDDFDSFISYYKKEKNYEFVYKNNFLKHLIQETNLQNWVDIEGEYFKELYKCAKNNNTDQLKKLHQDFDLIKEDLEEYLYKQSQESIEIKGYLENSLTNQSDDINNILLLNFNYTSFIKHYEIPKSQIIQIHGKLKNKENPIIFGYGNENAKQYKEIEEMNNNVLLINMKSILYGNTNNYKKLDDFVENDRYEIFILGHSCGLSDGTLLSMLFNHNNCFSIKPFYHKWEKGNDNYLDIRMNISRHFPDKNAFRKKVIDKELCCELK